MLALVPGFRLDQLMQAAGLSDAQGLNAAALAVILAAVSAATVGALLASRRPHHPVGWLLLGVGLGLAMNILVEAYVKYGLLVRPAAASSRPSTGASTAATTPPTRSRRSAPGSASRQTWTPSPPSCWPWSTRPCNRPGRRCGCGRHGGADQPERVPVAAGATGCALVPLQATFALLGNAA